MDARRAQAEALVRGLGQLKGAAMKVGQLLSLDSGDILPPEVARAMASLQSGAEPVSLDVMRKVVLEDLGTSGLEALGGFSEDPAAVASIGQVHRAWVEDEAVAVKVQYPGIAEAIGTDLALLRTLVDGSLALAGKKVPTGPLFEELVAVLEREADFVAERSAMDDIRGRLAGDSRFRVPRSVPHLCSRRVLTMEWVDGQPFEAWIASNPAEGARAAVAEALLDLYVLEFFEWGLVQTDPNPGNFLILEGGRLGLLDFGSTRSFEPDFRLRYRDLLSVAESGGREDIMRALTAFGLLDERESERVKFGFVELMRLALEPFSPSAQPFRFAAWDGQQRVRALALELASGLEFTAPPREILFLHRKLGGMFQLLRRMEVTVDLVPYWVRIMGVRITDAR